MSLHRGPVGEINGSRLKVAIVAAKFNPQWVDDLLVRCVLRLRAAGVAERGITIIRVPGSHEVPWAAARVARARKPDVVIALGVLLKGSTNHHELVATAVAHELLALSTRVDVPVINGVMAVDSPRQAADRCGERINRGREFAEAALEMASLARSL